MGLRINEIRQQQQSETMISRIKSLIHPITAKAVALTFVRDCMAGGIHHSAGDTGEFSEKTAAELIQSGAAFNPSTSAESAARQARLASLIPGPCQPEPLPDSWNRLTDPFKAWHELYQKADCLVRRRDLIEQKLTALVTRDAMTITPGAFDGIPAGHDRNRAIAASGRAIIKTDIDPNEQAERVALRDALERANVAISDFRNTYGDELAKQKILCGDEMISLHGRLTKLAREVSKTGLDLFSTRVQALGLGDFRTWELFGGSADYIKYHTEEPSLLDLKLAWSDHDGPRYFVDSHPARMVEQMTLWESDCARLSDLLKIAKAELARARKALTIAA